MSVQVYMYKNTHISKKTIVILHFSFIQYVLFYAPKSFSQGLSRSTPKEKERAWSRVDRCEHQDEGPGPLWTAPAKRCWILGSSMVVIYNGY